MIDNKCFTTEWIEKKAKELNYSDTNLIEKVIRALSLLDMLARSGCPFHFKRGSCLMLLLHDAPHRLSIDIDIMCPPGTDIEQYLASYADCGFIDYKQASWLEYGHCHAVPLCGHIPSAIYGVHGLWKTHLFFFAETLE